MKFNHWSSLWGFVDTNIFFSNSSQRNTLPKEDGFKFSNIPEENVFLAKHSLMRTPPQTARTEMNQERILKKAHSRAKWFDGFAVNNKCLFHQLNNNLLIKTVFFNLSIKYVIITNAVPIRYKYIYIINIHAQL